MYNSYFSFLICSHPDLINIYYTGIHIGSIHKGEFKICKIKQGDIERELTIQDLPDPCPFSTIEELKNYLIEIIKKINLKEKS
jgi:hypothetical protein